MADGRQRRSVSRRAREVVRTWEFQSWVQTLDEESRVKVRGAEAWIAACGPTLGRPRVDVIHGARMRKLKEARIDRGTRVLFAFDSNQNAVMLVGGDKTGEMESLVPAEGQTGGTPLLGSRAEYWKGASLSEPTRSEKDVRAEEQVNELRAAIYGRLMEAQDRIAHARYKRGVSHQAVVAALDAADETLSEDERRDDLYLSALAHYVEALGGRLEVWAVFDDDSVIIRRQP